MEKNLSNINYLKKMISRFNRDIDKYKLSIYLFGSYLDNSSGNDIDILMLYKFKTSKIHELLSFKNKFRMVLANELNKDIDLVLLTYQEEAEIKFIKKENAIKLIDYLDEKQY